MIALLDINVLVALLDGGHRDHSVARAWLVAHIHTGWASCPLTQNGSARILSQPAYSNPVPTSLALEKLARACATTAHTFWADDVSLLDPSVARHDRIHTARQLTDIYLLALAVHHGGRLVTFDRSIAARAVKKATTKHLVVI